MNKSIIIIISAVWLICTMYFTLAQFYPDFYPHGDYAKVGSWLASFLLLICIIIYVKKHMDKKKVGND